MNNEIEKEKKHYDGGIISIVSNSISIPYLTVFLIVNILHMPKHVSGSDAACELCLLAFLLVFVGLIPQLISMVLGIIGMIRYKYSSQTGFRKLNHILTVIGFIEFIIVCITFFYNLEIYNYFLSLFS